MRREVTDKTKKRSSKFRSTLKKRRLALEMTTEQLALKAGMSVDTIRAIEGGRSLNPGFFYVADILRALNIDLGEVEKWAGNKD